MASQLSVLVTGGAGFIGSNIVHDLAVAGHAVTVCDKFEKSARWRNLAAADLSGLVLPENLPALLQRQEFDLVVHMGAISSTTETDVDLIIRTNIDLSLMLWDYCVARGARFIYASSAATYGDGENGFDADWSLPELSKLRPLNAYGWSKHLFDCMIVRRRDAGAPTPPQWAGLKFFNVFGPNEYHKDDMRSVALKVFEQIRAGEPVRLFKSHREGFEDGGQLRDFIYVRDCVAVVNWLIATPDVHGILNVGTGRARSFRDLAAGVFTALGMEPRIEYIDMPQHLRAQYQYFTEAETGRLRQAGYQAAFTPLEDAVRDYVQTYLAQGMTGPQFN